MAGRTSMAARSRRNSGAEEDCPVPRGPGAPAEELCAPAYWRCGCRIWPLPFDSNNVAAAAGGVPAGVRVRIPAEPQRPFLAESMLVPDTLAPFFDIDDIRVGTTSQLVFDGAQAAQNYTQDAVNNFLNLQPAGPGLNVILDVTNNDVVARRFQATMFGRAVRFAA